MHVLVPIDGSEPARAAIEHAVTTFPDADITALHVVNPSMSTYRTNSHLHFERLVELEEERAETLFETAREIADEHGREASLTTETVVGEPIRDIVEFAEENDVDQIVIGSHGRSGVSRVLLGSVAEQVVRRASMPVTVVR
ncbi:universal stress protein (plasmid) [Haloterrigena salifodinae]|uniref:Universal stress protein n=1 Tax=Haloterrigena salifodinae TaxID=2675099 RepID=A0A8T8E7K6_9EURY|nr:universal stress protein [Haloterrigena salifodinae]QRV17708.1 universal stress protein [Haloterrigena salifodinae]